MHMHPAGSSSRRHPSCDGCNSLRSSSRRLASCDGCNRLRPSRGEDSAIYTHVHTSRLKLTRSTVIIIIVTFLIAGWLLPEVSAVVNQNETKSTTITWGTAGSDPERNQTSNTAGPLNRRWSQVSRRGDNPSYPGENSSRSAVSLPNQTTAVENGFRNATKENSEKSGISSTMRSREQNDVGKIISIVVPFTCVILVAGTLCVTYKLCHRYRCYNNKPNLTKCLTFCDRCMSTPYVFQLSDDKKDSNRTTSVSSDSGRLFRYSFNSISSSSSRISPTPSPSANSSHRHSRQTPGANYSPVRHSSSSSSLSGTSRPGHSPRLSSTSSSHSGVSPRLSSTSSSHSGVSPRLSSTSSSHSGASPRLSSTSSAHSGASPRLSSTSSTHSGASSKSPRSFKPLLRAITSRRQRPDLPSASNPASVGSTAVCSDPRPAQAKQPTTGQSQRPSFHLSRQLQRPSFHLSRQSHTGSYSRASGQSRGSLQSPPQPHRVAGAIFQRQDSAR